jgi:hemerythrin-like metal-binding protein
LGRFTELTWKDSFNSGHPLIDGQHRGLFSVANELLVAARAARPKQELIDIVHRLMDDIVRHFSDEEDFLESIGFVELEDHVTEHARLVSKGRALLDAFHGDNLHLAELFQFFAYDIVTRHMLGTDRRFFPYVGDHV